MIINPCSMRASRIVSDPVPVPKPVVARVYTPRDNPSEPIAPVRPKGYVKTIRMTEGMLTLRERAYAEACAYLDVDRETWRDTVFGSNRMPTDTAIRECMAILLCFKYGRSQPEAAAIMSRPNHSSIAAMLKRFFERTYGGLTGMKKLGADFPKYRRGDAA